MATGDSVKTGHGQIIADSVDVLRTSGDRVIWFDDFIGDALDSRYSGSSGGDAQASDPAINEQLNGVVRMTTGDSNQDLQNDASSLTLGLNFQVDQGRLVYQARAQIDSVSDVLFTLGLTDTLATTLVEMPFYFDASDNLTAQAQNAVGITFDSQGTSNFFATASSTSTYSDGDSADTGLSASANTWYDIRIEVDGATGDTDYYIDGTRYATITSAINTSTALTPIAVATSRTTTSKNLDVDYLLVGQDR